MAKLDFAIYGYDDTDTAAACAAAALANPHPSKYGGACTGAEASKGGGNDAAVSNGEVKVMTGMGNDSRAVSKGGHGVSADAVGRKEK